MSNALAYMETFCSYCVCFLAAEKFSEGARTYRICTKKAPGTESEKTEFKKRGGLLIGLDTPACPKFALAEFFLCEANNYRMSPDVCQGRMKNHKGLIAFERCDDCPQFLMHIQPVLHLRNNGNRPIKKLVFPKKKKLKIKWPRLKT